MEQSKTPIFEDGKLVGFSGGEGQGKTSAPQAEEESPSLLQEAGRAVVGGIRDGAQEIANTVEWGVTSVGNAITGGHDLYYTGNDGFEWLTLEEAKARDDIPEWQTRSLFGDDGTMVLPEVAENETTAGGMARGVTQFVAGYGAIGKAANLAKAQTVAGAATQAMALGAVTDFATFDAHEDRFADFLQDNVGLRDPITSYLAVDADDSILEGKLKNSIEGLGMGLATDGVIRLVKAFKGAKKVQIEQGDEAAVAHMNEALAGMADDLETKEVADGNGRGDALDVSEAGGPSVDVGLGDAPDHVEPRTVNTEGLTAALSQEIALRKAGSDPNPARELEGTLFNFDNMESDVDIKDVMNMAADDIVAHRIKDTTTFDAIVEDAKGFLTEAVDVSPQVIDASLARMAQDAHKQQGIVIAGKALVQSLAREVELLAYRIDAGEATEQQMEKFIRLEQRLVETSANLKSVITGSAQTTAAGRIKTADWLDGSEIATQDMLGSRLSMDGGIEGIRMKARAIKLNKETKGGERGLLRIVEADGSAMRVVNEVYINSILSGPKTHMVNFMSNALNTVLLPTEKMIGGALRRDKGVMREGMRQFQGIYLALKDSFKMAGQSFKAGRNILDPEAAILEANGVDYHAVKYGGENPFLQTVINGRAGLGNFIRFPSRMLLTGDELFKQINYRANLYARLSTEAVDLVAAGKLTKEQAGKFVADRLDTAYDNKGGARSQVDLDFAREATFTQDLRSGSLSKGVQDLTNRHPALKLILPFVRTPTNILKAGLQRTPGLHRLSQSMKADLASGDPRRIASAQGKLATGSMFWGMGITMALEGRITGSGPKDPALRARMMETGWRPYSVVMSDGNGGKRYVEYRRFEPFAMFLGIAADIAEIGGQVDEAEMSELATAALVGFVNNVASKTYLQGLVDTVEAISDPERYLPSLMNQYASAMVPQSSFLREMRKQQDPEMREVRSMVDAVMNTVPGFSDNLPARRSWITGEPIAYPQGWGADMVSPVGEAFAAANPIIAGDWAEDPVLDELASLEFGFSAPTRKLEGIELTSAQYSRLLELHGTVRIGQATMKQALEKAFNSQVYDRERKRFADDPDPSLNLRVQIVQKIVTNYRKAARAMLLREDASIRKKVIQRKRDASASARAAYSGIAELAN